MFPSRTSIVCSIPHTPRFESVVALGVPPHLPIAYLHAPLQLLAEARSGVEAWRACVQMDSALARRTVFRLVRYLRHSPDFKSFALCKSGFVPCFSFIWLPRCFCRIIYLRKIFPGHSQGISIFLTDFERGPLLSGRTKCREDAGRSLLSDRFLIRCPLLSSFVLFNPL